MMGAMLTKMEERTASSVLKIKSHGEVPYAEIAIGPKLTRSSVMLTYEGELQGEGVLEELKISFAGSASIFNGFQRFTGKLAGMEGSFILRHDGRFVGGKTNANLTVVPGSATGSLKGLRGEMKIRSFSEKEFPVTFNYRFV